MTSMRTARASLYAPVEGHRDALTGLPNRIGWDEAITRADEERAVNPTTESLIALDVDCLTIANDTRGSEVGDDLLRTVVTIVRGAIREQDLVARIGGDEFAVLLHGADEAACVKAVTRLRDAFARSASLDGFPISVAMGFATAADADTLTRAQRWAEARMFVDKTEPSRLEFVRAVSLAHLPPAESHDEPAMSRHLPFANSR